MVLVMEMVEKKGVTILVEYRHKPFMGLVEQHFILG